MVALPHRTPVHPKQTPEELRFMLLFCGLFSIVSLHGALTVESEIAEYIYTATFFGFVLGGFTNAVWLAQMSTVAVGARLGYGPLPGRRD